MEQGPSRIETRGDRVIRFIENLTITSGTLAGTPFMLRPWQKEIVKAVYDPVNSDGRRIVRQALFTCGRKQGKTALSAALVLAHLAGPEREARGQIYSAAADREQAGLIYEECKAMIQADPELSSRVNIIDSKKRIVHSQTGSFYRAISSESRTAHGFSASCVIYDELAQAPNRKLYDALTTSTAARLEPLTIIISTQSSDPNSIMSQLVDYGKQLNDGVLEDERFKAFIYSVPEEADPWNEKNWYLANPALGDFRSLEEMRDYAKKARRIPALEAAFRALYLNQRIDAEARFISTEDWSACGAKFDPEQLRGAECWAGLDLSSTNDLSALVLYFPVTGAVLPFFWVPKENLNIRSERDRVPYDVWARQGHVMTTEGKSVDRRAIAKKMAEITMRYSLRGVGYDRWRMEDLRHILDEEGITIPLLPFGQGYADMAPAVDALEILILNGGLKHGGNPVLRWNASNVVVTLDPAGNRKLDKSKSRERIDGIVALAMAVGVHAKSGKKEYNSRILEL